MRDEYDVVVLGGGAAGLSAALTLGRSRRSVLVIDSGAPRNARAEGVHNYLGREGTPPTELLAIGRGDVERYGGEVVLGAVAAVEGVVDGFVVNLADRGVVRARRIVVATGAYDELPDVPGVEERWGRDVIHCPYCHGWEVRDQAIGVLATSALASHQVHLFRQLSDDVTLFLHTANRPDDDEVRRMAARGIAVVEGKVAGLEVADDRLVGVRLDSGDVVPVQALAVQSRARSRTDALRGLGLEPAELEMGGEVLGTFLPADPTGATAVPGVWVAGNVADVRAQVISSAASGVAVAAALNAELVQADIAASLQEQRQEHEHEERRHGDSHAEVPVSEASWEERYRSADALWSGAANVNLVAEVADLPPGTALDVGSGEGGDAIWLAQHGWRVTAADFSTVALDRGAAHAAGRGADVAERITWQHADVLAWTPPSGFDLVSAQYLHLHPEPRRAVYSRMAEAVAVGGTLLVVGHSPSDLHGEAHRPAVPEMFFTPEQVVELLEPDRWEIVTAEERPRPAKVHEGHDITVGDTVVRARRLA